MSNNFTRLHVNMFGGNIKTVTSGPVLALADGVDVAATVCWVSPANCSVKVAAARFLPNSTATVSGDGSVLAIKNGSTVIATVTKTTNYAIATPVALTISSTDADLVLAPGTTVTYTINNGTTVSASPPGAFQIDYVIVDA